MNCVYFACPRCRSYLDAGYRWAYWNLEEPGIVNQPEAVEIDRVFSTGGYWETDDVPTSNWLREGVLPKVRAFLQEHREHSVLYVDEDWIYHREDIGESWREVETWHKIAKPSARANGPQIES